MSDADKAFMIVGYVVGAAIALAIVILILRIIYVTAVNAHDRRIAERASFRQSEEILLGKYPYRGYTASLSNAKVYSVSDDSLLYHFRNLLRDHERLETKHEALVQRVINLESYRPANLQNEDDLK